MNILVLFAGQCDLMFLYSVPPTFQNFSRMSYDVIHNAHGTPADATEFEETIVMKNGM